MAFLSVSRFNVVLVVLIAIVPLALVMEGQAVSIRAEEAPALFLQRLASWPLSAKEARVLHLAQVGPREYRDRLFYADSSGSALLWGGSLESRRGTNRYFVRDESTGAWIAMTLDTGIRAESLNALFAESHERDTANEPIAVSFATSEGLEMATALRCGECSDLSRQLLAWLIAEEAMEPLAHTLSPQTRDSILFLAQSLPDLHSATKPGGVEGSAGAPLLQLLALVLSQTTESRELERESAILEFFGKDTSLLPLPYRMVERSFAEAYLDQPWQVPVPAAAFSSETPAPHSEP